MNPTMMSMVMNAIQGDKLREAEKHSVFENGQAGGGKSPKKIETALTASGMILLLVVWAILVV